MMRRILPPIVVGLCLSALCGAHHSLVKSYDLDHTVQITGVVTEVEWVNPHVRYFVDVAENGGARNWNVEAMAPHMMISSGIDRNTVKVGDRIALTGYPGKNIAPGVKQALAMTRAVFAGGQRVEIDPVHWTMNPVSR